MKFYLLRVFLSLILLISAFKVCGNYSQDSLISRINGTKNVIEKTKLLNDLSRSYFDIDYTKSIQIANQALNLAKREKYNDAIIDAYRIIGYSYFYLKNYDKSLKHYFCATSFFDEIEDKTKLIKTYHTIAYIYNIVKNAKLALRYNNLAHKLLNEIGDKNLHLTSLANYATSYFLLKEYHKTIAYARESMAFGDSTNLLDVGPTYIQIGSAFWYLHQYDSALKYYNNHLQISIRQDDSLGIARAYSDIGTAYYSKRDYNKAISFYDKSIALAQEYVMAHTYLEYVDSYLKLNNIEKATFYFDLAKQEKVIDLEELVDACKAMTTYYKQNNLANKAFQYTDIGDSIKDVITLRAVANSQEMQAKVMEVANNELLREDLKKEKESNDLQRKFNYLLLAFIALLIISAFFTVRHFYLRRIEAKKTANEEMINLEKGLNIFDELKLMNAELNKERETNNK